MKDFLKKYKKWFVLTLIVAVIAAPFIINGINSILPPSYEGVHAGYWGPPLDSSSQSSVDLSSQKETPSSSQASSSSSSSDPEINIFSAGMYKVGVDIPAGDYYVEADGAGYFSVTSDSTGQLDSIISNDNFNTFTFVTVSDGQYLTVNRAKFAPSNEIGPISTRGEGMYRIGIDLPAGEYKLKAPEKGYYATLANCTGRLDSIISNDNFAGEKYITVSNGQYLQLSRALIVQ